MAKPRKKAQLDLPISLDARSAGRTRTNALVRKVRAILARDQTVTIEVDSAKRRDALLKLLTARERARLGFIVRP